MPQTFASLPERQLDLILCSYTNTSSHIQVIKITGLPYCYFERTVFPGQQILFETVPEAQLKVFTGEMVQAIVKDTIPCQSLCLSRNESVAFVPRAKAVTAYNCTYQETAKISRKEDVLL